MSSSSDSECDGEETKRIKAAAVGVFRFEQFKFMIDCFIMKIRLKFSEKFKDHYIHI